MSHHEILNRFEFPNAHITADALHVTTPVDGTRIAALAPHTSADVESMIVRAVAAFNDWKLVPRAPRGELVRLLGRTTPGRRSGALRRSSPADPPRRAGEVREMIDICDFAVGLSRQLYG
jgi:aldehyde dehydrogenase (NAD+)